MLFILIAVFSLLLQFFLPWWIIAPVSAVLAALVGGTARNAFFSSFMAIFVMWIGVSLSKSIPNQHLLSGKVAVMLGLPQSPSSWIIVLLATGIIGGLTASVSALAGYYWRAALKKK
ncbi:hypothetical protein [Hufsiella ginkgonis]|uniref:Uncharacterized protein n=1 Tax=Hufsiella ginkgonis TaxID=2695274 RepID=A0A7K1XVW3_9SPHI|nr:hypothetical protein [Hufsiella ginkgonis]MXV15124.1 hypothetical protein [Hufsiella ginkgonis]